MEEGFYEEVFYYRVAKDVGLAQDDEGNPVECYTSIHMTMEGEPFSPEERDEVAQEMTRAFAESFGFDPGLLALISKEEYDAAVDEEGADQ